MTLLGSEFARRVGDAVEAGRLSRLDPVRLARLRAGETRLETAAGSLLPQPCDEPHLGLVVDGAFRVSIAGPDGRLLTVRYVRRGDLIGAPSIFGRAAAIADFRAVVDTSVLLFDVDRVTDLAGTDPSVALMLADELAVMLRIAVGELAAMAFEPVRRRVARHLFDLAIDRDKAIHPAAPRARVARVTQQELAEAVGSVREVVARVLRQLRDDGVIETGAAGIVVLDPARLCDAAAVPQSVGRALDPSPPVSLRIARASA